MSSSSASTSNIKIVSGDSKEDTSTYIRSDETEQKSEQPTSTSTAASAAAAAPSSSSSTSNPIDLNSPFQYLPKTFSRHLNGHPIRSYLTKWNIYETSSIFQLRYLKNDFNFLEPSSSHQFFVDLFNSSEFRTQFRYLHKNERCLEGRLSEGGGGGDEVVTKVQIKSLKTTKVDLHMFDKLWNQEETIVYGAVTDPLRELTDPSESSVGVGRGGSTASSSSSSSDSNSGELKKCFEDVLDGGITIGDELHKCILDPSSDHYELFTPAERQELLFILFRHLIVGGGLNQYENNIQPYLSVLKHLYRDLCTIKTNRLTNDVEIANLVFKIDGISVKNGGDSKEVPKSIFGTKEKDKYHLCIASVDTMNRYVTIYYFAHTDAW